MKVKVWARRVWTLELSLVSRRSVARTLTDDSDLVVLFSPVPVLDVTICIFIMSPLYTTWLLSSSDETIDIMVFIFSPDLHCTLDLGVDVDKPEMPKELGHGINSKLVMEVMRGVD